MIKKIAWLITNIFSLFLGAFSAIIHYQLKERKKAVLPQNSNDELLKWKEFYRLFNKWLILKQQGKNLESYFNDRGYTNIAVYGMRELGLRLIDELKGTSVRILYGIDKNAERIKHDLDIYTPGDHFPKADVIVVTAIHYFPEIQKDLNIVCNYPVISLKDVVESVG